MSSGWSAEQIVALAPDAASASAGRSLSMPAPWSDTGVSTEPSAVWGLCRGSGKNPYQTIVDLSGPAYKCSCPSRKFPCKHALGLLLLWSTGNVAAGAVPEWAWSWLTTRGEKAVKAATVKETPPDPAAAAKRVAAREEKVAAGLAELDRWCCDQIRGGLASAHQGGYAHIEAVAARMVDAQAPGVAAALRRLPGLGVGEGWHRRWLVELSSLRLLANAHTRLSELPDGLAATVRERVGYPVAKEDVLSAPGVADVWQVLGLRTTVEERLTARRVWLRGAGTGRFALVLSFAPRNQPLDASLVPGTELAAELFFYPGAAPLRALVGENRGDPRPLTGLVGESVGRAYSRLREALGADPWTSAIPVVLGSVTPVPWQLVDTDGASVPLQGGDNWKMLAVSGGHPVTVAGELGLEGVRPLCVVADDGTLVRL